MGGYDQYTGRNPPKIRDIYSEWRLASQFSLKKTTQVQLRGSQSPYALTLNFFLFLMAIKRGSSKSLPRGRNTMFSALQRAFTTEITPYTSRLPTNQTRDPFLSTLEARPASRMLL
ncbi:uncharacterized protein EV154DRAFT_552079 [Mucor mucedo]|uniref:uncharacterized protein n=1 Tax=Mucor mucedo TaxID=29922 RepID=UPI002220827D|nr:uncharacterized protein EV154DRAFT_552079 [Mucor mucedo]KAI7890665.1 hypothetical protein EV154DRAFT_552079 [Mucor mucedo]